MSGLRVYLAGPITGLDFKGATDWREFAKQSLKQAGIIALSPMRGKEYLSHVTKFGMDGDQYAPFSVLSSNRGIMTRDRWDATRSDILLVNLLGAKTVSIGTVMEIAMADVSRNPIVCAMEETGNPHDHGMIREALGYRIDSLEGAIDLVKAIAQ